MTPTRLLVVVLIPAAVALFVSMFSVAGWPGWLRAIIFVACLILMVVAGIWQVRSPVLKVQRESASKVAELAFESLLAVYLERNPGTYDLRANVMMVRRSTWGIGGRYLQIEYCSGGYRAAERSLRYSLGIGCCGTAFAQNTEAFYDRTLDHENQKGMPAEHRDITSGVQSVVSIPIYRPGDSNQLWPVGILNLDSSASIEDTKFRDDGLRAVAIQYAGLFGTFVP